MIFAPVGKCVSGIVGDTVVESRSLTKSITEKVSNGSQESCEQKVILTGRGASENERDGFPACRIPNVALQSHVRIVRCK